MLYRLNEGLFKEAMFFLNKGMSVIPVYGKKPTLDWAKYQKRLMSDDEARDCFTSNMVTGLALVTGELSGVVVVDIDKGSKFDLKRLPKTLMSKSGNKGIHLFFKYPKKAIIRNCTSFEPYTDIRGEGGYAVIPPSTHLETLKHYEWITNIDTPMAELPDWFIEQLQKQKLEVKETNSDQENIFAGVGEGKRNDTATRIIGMLLKRFEEENWERIVWELIKGWNTKNTPPLNEKELRATFESIAAREQSSQNQSTNGADDVTNKFFSATDLLKREFSDDVWIVDKLIPRDGITCLAGEVKVGKSFLSLQIAQCIAEGKPLFNRFAVRRSPVLLISKEDPEWMIQKRLKMLHVSEDSASAIHFRTSNDVFFDDPKTIGQITDFIEKNNIGFVIVDSLRRVIRGDENNSQSINPVHHHFKSLIKKGASVLFIHHIGKESTGQKEINKPRGSSDIAAMVDSLINVERKRGTPYLCIKPAALRQDYEYPAFEIEIPPFTDRDNQFKFLGEVGNGNEQSSQDIAETDILELLKTAPELYQTEIVDRLITEKPPYQVTTIKNALAELERRNQVCVRKDGRKQYYSLPGTANTATSAEEGAV